MKKFNFRLDSVLRLYEAKLELEKQKLAQTLGQEQQVLRTIAGRTQEMRRQNEALRELIELRSADLRALSAYNLSAQTHMIVLHEELARIRSVLHLQREAVAREERKVKLVSKLKAAKRAEWEQAVNRQLELESQEISLAVNRIK
jgi:hypothetical protein